MRSNTQMKNIVYALSALVCALWTMNSITKQNNTVWVRFIPQWKFSASLSTFASVKPGTHWQQSWKLNSTRSTLLEVDCCRNRQQIGNKVDCRRYDRLCCQCVPVFKLLFQFRCSMTFNIDDSQHKGTVSTKPKDTKVVCSVVWTYDVCAFDAGTYCDCYWQKSQWNVNKTSTSIELLGSNAASAAAGLAHLPLIGNQAAVTPTNSLLQTLMVLRKKLKTFLFQLAFN